MFNEFSDEAKQVMKQASEEARRLNHGYVGTEHILLALLSNHSEMFAEILRKFGVSVTDIRAAVERLITRGPAPVIADPLPLTPRAKQVIAFGREGLTVLHQKQVDVEHLFIGLMREPDGVAGQALRALNLDLKQVADELLKIRLLQMTIVERTVRPLHASIARKRKMREELLAHLESVYEEERARHQDPVAAIQEAARRFGNPPQLARELQSALPLPERIEYRVQRIYGWRAPESAWRYTARQAALSFSLIFVVCFLTITAYVLHSGWDSSVWLRCRPGILLLLIVPADQFSIGMLYFKMRDATFGVFGQRKSRSRVIVYNLLIALIVLASGLAFVGFTEQSADRALQLLLPFGIAGIVSAVVSVFQARLHGLDEIRDTVWACLDLNRPTPGASTA